MVTPSTSLGSMSLVNCKRWKPQATARAKDCASVVLPTPGTSSISRWPRANRQTSESRTTSGFPRIADCTALSSSPNLASNCGAKGTGGTTMVSRCGIQRYCIAGCGRTGVPPTVTIVPMLRRIRRSATLLLLACASLAGEVRTLTILHLNDLHAHISPENGRGGFAYLAAVIKRERANCADCILFNAGDLVQGSPVSTIFRGKPMYQLANLLGFDAACLGNHEFDYGWAQAASFAQIAR